MKPGPRGGEVLGVRLAARPYDLRSRASVRARELVGTAYSAFRELRALQAGRAN